MAFIPLLVGATIGFFAAKAAGGNDQPQQQLAQPTNATPANEQLPATPTPAPQAQSTATQTAQQAAAKQRRRSVTAGASQVQPRGRRSSVQAPTGLTQPVMLLGGGG